MPVALLEIPASMIETMNIAQTAVPWAAQDAIRITSVDAHAAGEPLRVIVSGFPEPPGRTILERRRSAREQFDALRTALMWEPRGHADMYGCILVPPERANSDFGVLFTHNEGFSTMCGHGIIALSVVVLETGLVKPVEPVTTLRFDTPAGLVVSEVAVANGTPQRVAFRNVPSFVVALDQTVAVPGIGNITYDLAFGGAFYAYVRADEVGLTCTPADYRRLIETGMAIKHAVMQSRPIEHPEDPDLGYLYGTIFTGPAEQASSHSRNVCIFADGEVDRSPTGTGVSGRLAIHHARGEIGSNEEIVIESILGTTFSGRVLERVRMAGYDAIVPEVAGMAHLTGRHEFVIDPRDPLRNGFILR
jgi:trans-L-3-hydroxyproline dehydratase